MAIWPYIRILGIVWLEICVKNSLKNELSYEINYVIIDGLFIKLSITALVYPRKWMVANPDPRTNQGGYIGQCHRTRKPPG